jgi:hypothetical protein
MSWTVRAYRDGDEHKICALLAHVFAVDYPVDLYRHTFLQNPAGASSIVVAEAPDGEIVGHLAGYSVESCQHQKRRTLLHGGNTVIHPKYRSYQNGRYLFQDLVAVFNDEISATQKMVYGLPNSILLRSGQGTLAEQELVNLGELEYQVRTLGSPPQDSPDIQLEPVSSLAAESIVSGIPARAVQLHKDQSYLAWRYERPTKTYFPLKVFRRGEAIGLLVIGEYFASQRCVAVAEWLLPEMDLANFQQILAAVEALAQNHGIPTLLFAFPPRSREHQHLAASGYQHEKSGLTLCAWTSDPALQPQAQLLAEWFYTLGDFDLI